MLKPTQKVQLKFDKGCLKPMGNLTIESVPGIDKQLSKYLSKFDKQVRVDLSEANNNDTAGLAWLVNLKAGLLQKNIKLSFTNVPDSLKKLSKLSDADTLLEIE